MTRGAWQLARQAAGDWLGELEEEHVWEGCDAMWTLYSAVYNVIFNLDSSRYVSRRRSSGLASRKVGLGMGMTLTQSSQILSLQVTDELQRQDL